MQDSTLTVIINAIKGQERDYTTGNLNQALFILAIPMVIEMFMESLFALVDVFFVSQVSVDANDHWTHRSDTHPDLFSGDWF